MNTLLLIFVNLSILVIAYIISMIILNEYAKKYNMSLASLLNIDYDATIWVHCYNLSLAVDCINRAAIGCAGAVMLMLVLMRFDGNMSTNDALLITVMSNLVGISIFNTLFVIDGISVIRKIHKKLHKQPIKF